MGPSRKVFTLPETAERFWSKVNKGKKRECWNWTAHLTPYGYGDFTYNRRVYPSNRMAMMLTLNRMLATAECVLHRCDNPRCCNPRHLRIGTKAENQKEMAERKRGKWGGGLRITEKHVKRMRRMRSNGYNLKQISQSFGISHTWASAILTGRARK